jgi:alpha-aminoadipic semialdehyde synthase
MIDSLWALGRRLEWEGAAPNPFRSLKQTHHYPSLEAAFEAVERVGDEIARDGLPESLRPFVVGFAGYGNVSQGAQEVLDRLPMEPLAPEGLSNFHAQGMFDPKKTYKVVFHEKDMVRPRAPEGTFDLQEYYDHPDRYESAFEPYLSRMNVLMNCIYWDTPYPRFFTKAAAKALYEEGAPALKVVGDISCDIDGAVEFTHKATHPDAPVYVYEPAHDRAADGVEGEGIVVMAVDNLPCELPRESSMAFSEGLKPFVGALAKADYARPFERLELPEEIKKAMIVYQGALTPDYRFMERFIG